MTDEERDKTLKILEGMVKAAECREVFTCPHDDFVDAQKFACEALRAEPCEDTISRKHLLSEIDDLMKSPWFNNGKGDGTIMHYGYVERKEAVEVVRDLCVEKEPSVTPKQRTGKWMKTPKKVMGEGFMWYCSECKREVYEDTEVGYPRDKYCSYCGAQMEADDGEG